MAFLSDIQIRQFGLTNLTTKESKMLLSTINKSLRENKKAIIQSRKQENQTMQRLEMKVNTIKQNLQGKQPNKLSKSFKKNLTATLNQIQQQSTSQLRPTSAASKTETTPSPLPTPKSPPPRPRKPRTRGPRQRHIEEDEDDYQEAPPPKKKERSRSLKRVIFSTQSENWGKKDEEKKATAPIRHFRAHFIK